MADPTYDYAQASGEDKDKVRLLISDTGGQDDSSFVFSDEEITTFLDLEAGSVFMAASTALRAIANNEVQTAKVIRFLDISTDGAKVADALNKLADTYEQKAEDADYDFEIANMTGTDFARRELRGIELP